MHQSRFARLIAGVLVTLAFAGCAQTTSSAVPAPTPVVSVTPTAPNGDYAFIRNGDIWVHLGSAPSHAITKLHLSAASALWGSLTWSPDHATLAFVLNAPPIAPGFTAKNPVQDTGTLFLVDVVAGKLTAVPGAGAVPIMGRHVAWTTYAGRPVLAFTQNGTVSLYTPSQNQATTLTLPQHVWEIVTRGATLFYTRANNIAPTGTAAGELHALYIPNATDSTIAQLGAITLPAALCSSLLCPPDTATPAVPFAWSVSGDGTLVAYESSLAATAPTTSNPTPQTTPVPTTTRFYIAQRGGGAPRVIFAQIPAPAFIATWQMALSPDGQYAVLSLAQPTTANYGPFVQPLTGNAAPQNLAQADQQVGGRPAWSPTSQGFTLTAVASGPQVSGPQDHTLATFLVNGQRITTERSGDDLVWGE